MCGVKRPTHGIKPCLNLIYLILDNSNQQETIIEYFPGDDLESARQRIADFLGQKLRLRLRPKKTHISACEKGITLLGQRVFCTHRLLLKPNVRRFTNVSENACAISAKASFTRINSKPNSIHGLATPNRPILTDCGKKYSVNSFLKRWHRFDNF